MLGALIKAVTTAVAVIVIPILLIVLVGILGISWKLFLLLLAIMLPFIIIGLIYGYLAGREA